MLHMLLSLLLLEQLSLLLRLSSYPSYPRPLCLPQARARADLRPVATADDAKDIIEVYGHTPFACPSLLAQAAAATGCTDTSGNAALAVSCGCKPIFIWWLQQLVSSISVWGD